MDDLTSICLSSFNTKVSEKDLRDIWCKRCENKGCGFAALKAGSKWENRMMTQVDRLLINPRFASPDSDVYLAYHDQNFLSLEDNAYKIMIANHNKDWEPVSQSDIDFKKNNHTPEGWVSEKEPNPSMLDLTSRKDVEEIKVINENSDPQKINEHPTKNENKVFPKNIGNTPAAHSILLPGSPKITAPKPKEDSWALPTKPKAVETIPVGGKIKLS